jgi:ligand-binding sensor domain-containing protein/signal transduction histidine kinase
MSATGKTAAQFRFDSWTTDNGLPQASVNAILQTRDGFLWLATFGGLVRYDGLRFQVFNSGNTKGLKTSRFQELYEDREGALWISTELQGVTRYKDGVFNSYSTEHGLPVGVIHMREDANGNLLASVNTGDATSDHSVRWTGENFVPCPRPPTEPIVIWSRTESSFWYQENSRLRKLENGQVTVDCPFEPRVRRAFEDSEKRLWIAVDGTTTLYMLADNHLTSYSTKDGLFDYRFSNAFEDRQKRVWFGSQGGLTLFKDGKFTNYTAADGLTPGGVLVIYQDREGTIWLGTTGGLTRLTERAIAAYSARDGIAGDNVYAIYEDHTGKIWIGSWLGLTQYENGAFQNVGKAFGLGEADITSFYEDREGDFWIGTLAGVYRIRNGEVKVYPRSELPGGQVRAIYEDREGNVWFGVGDRLVKYRNESFTKYEDQSLAGRIYALHADAQGGLWIGTGTGLVVYRDGTFKPLTEKDGFAGGMVRAIAEDSAGTLWIGMYDSGLYRFKDGRLTHYTTNEGLFDNGAFQILEDNQGYFWISCNLGVYRVRKSDLNDYADSRIKRITSVPYNKRDGMLNAECNGGTQPAGIKARDGRLWFPTQQGVAVINPDTVPFNSQPPPVVIEAIAIDSHPVDLTPEIRLQPGQTYLEIHYSGLSFINPELVNFKYLLEGSDREWIDAGTRHVAYYTHLPPGKYRFRVRAANRDGVWNEQGAMLTIVVLPYFWQKWWFVVALTLLAAAFVYLIYRRRILILKEAHAAQEAFSRRLIESQEAERKRIAAGLHDNLGQRLIIIKNWASLGLNFTAKDAPVREQLDEISTTAVTALNEVREIIYDLRPYQLETIGLTRTIRFMVEQVAASSGIDFKSECDDLDNLFMPEDEVTFYRMIQECVSNVVKHSAAKHAGVEIKRAAKTVKIIVTDDGKGFVPEARTAASNGGFGLTGLHERVKILGGRLEIHSQAAQGTVISIDLALK